MPSSKAVNEDESSSHMVDEDLSERSAGLLTTGTLAKRKQQQKNAAEDISKNPHLTRSTRKRRVKKTGKGASFSLAQVIKYAALALLVTQMVGLVMLMRYSRTHPSSDGKLYLASTAVFWMEVLKLLICAAVAAGQHGLQPALKQILQPMEVAKLSVPSVLYTIQNNLLYLALSHLDAATYQVCYQLKILTTALFSMVLLGRTFSHRKWVALVILTLGVIIVQLAGTGGSHPHNHPEDVHHHHHLQSGDTERDASKTEAHHRVVGLVAVLCAACTSGFSGVYFEKILKGSTTSLWVRNIQMGLPSVLVAWITIYLKDAASVRQEGLFVGYTSTVWVVIIVQAAGGLIVATVVKYADNVLKVFAASFSIVVSCIVSALFFDFEPTVQFIVGATLVVSATVLYSMPEKRKAANTILPLTRRS